MDPGATSSPRWTTPGKNKQDQGHAPYRVQQPRHGAQRKGRAADDWRARRGGAASRFDEPLAFTARRVRGSWRSRAPGPGSRRCARPELWTPTEERGQGTLLRCPGSRRGPAAGRLSPRARGTPPSTLAATTPEDRRRIQERLMEAARRHLRAKRYSKRTEDAYLAWIRRFFDFCRPRDPSSVGASDVKVFLTELAVSRSVGASTQNQAASALQFFFTQIIGRPLDPERGLVRAKRGKRLPVVLARAEVKEILAGLAGHYRAHRRAVVRIRPSTPRGPLDPRP